MRAEGWHRRVEGWHRERYEGEVWLRCGGVREVCERERAAQGS